MNIFHDFESIILTATRSSLPAEVVLENLPYNRITVEPPREAAHGDISTNVAMILAKPLGVAPRTLAEQIATQLRTHPDIAAVEVAGPGFINLRLTEAFWQSHLCQILAAGKSYGQNNIGKGQKVNVEYVSANPTGPLHAGHARISVVGDVIASLLAYVGYDVTKEFYINDSGGQAENLARSLYARYRAAIESHYIPDFPEGWYPGDYLVPVAQALAQKEGDRWLGRPEQEWLEHFRLVAVEAMMHEIRQDLDLLGVHQDVFSSEHALVAAGAVERVVAALDAQGLVYHGTLEAPKGKPDEDWEPREQLLFKSTLFGDDVDRPLQKSDGSWTYFAKDIAYHYDKYQRGAKWLIDVLGADHGGYVKRMKAAVKAMSQSEANLDIRICQLVKFMDQGEALKMSKRAGTFVTLRDILARVNKDVIRFMMMTRRDDVALDFDFAKVIEQSHDNPVFYVHYAYARICSVRRHAVQFFPGSDRQKLPSAADVQCLTMPAELFMIKVLSHWPRQVEMAARMCEPHRLAYYLTEVAAAFHALWTAGKGQAELRFIVPEDREASLARLALLDATASVIASGLSIFGVAPMEEMTV